MIACNFRRLCGFESLSTHQEVGSSNLSGRANNSKSYSTQAPGCCPRVTSESPPDQLLFMILTAYFDESGTHDGSAATVMGGMMASTKQWEKFDPLFEQAKRKFGFRVFHTRRFKHKTGDFRGWSDDKCLALVAHLAALTERAFMEAVTIAVKNPDYDNEYRTGDIPKKVRVPSKYGLCFQECLLHFLAEADKRKFRGRLRERAAPLTVPFPAKAPRR